MGIGREEGAAELHSNHIECVSLFKKKAGVKLPGANFQCPIHLKNDAKSRRDRGINILRWAGESCD